LRVFVFKGVTDSVMDFEPGMSYMDCFVIISWDVFITR